MARAKATATPSKPSPKKSARPKVTQKVPKQVLKRAVPKKKTNSKSLSVTAIALNTRPGKYPSRTDPYISYLRFNLFRGSTTTSEAEVTSIAGENRSPFLLVHPNFPQENLFACLPGSKHWSSILTDIPVNEPTSYITTTQHACQLIVRDGLSFDMLKGDNTTLVSATRSANLIYGSGWAPRSPGTMYGSVGRVMSAEIHFSVQCEGPTSGFVLMRFLDESHAGLTPSTITQMMLSDSRSLNTHRFRIKRGTQRYRFAVPVEDESTYLQIARGGSFYDGGNPVGAISKTTNFPLQIGKDRHPFGAIAICFQDVAYPTTTALPPVVELKSVVVIRVHVAEEHMGLVNGGTAHDERTAHQLILQAPVPRAPRHVLTQ